MKKSKFLKLAQKAAKDAGKIALNNFGKDLEVNYKKQNEPVTNVDKEAEETIVNTIQKKFPFHSIWTEERKEMDKSSDYRWVVDPLDGTVMYSHSMPFFGISIGLEYRGKPIMGLTHFPTLNRTYYAEKGKGSYMNGKRLSVSSTTPSDELLFLGSTDIIRYPQNQLTQFHDMLVSNQLKMKFLGSTALELSLVSQGCADACFEFRIKPGDISAGILIVREAGGEVITPTGKKADSDCKKIIACNKKVKDMVVKK